MYSDLLATSLSGVRLHQKFQTAPGTPHTDSCDCQISVYDLGRDEARDFKSIDDAQEPIWLGPERFSVPELLFHPDESVIEPVRVVKSGVNTHTALACAEWITRLTPHNVPAHTIRRPMGLAELMRRSIMSCPPILQRPMTQSIVLGGGLLGTPGLISRLTSEMRSSMPSAWPLQMMWLSERASDTTWM